MPSRIHIPASGANPRMVDALDTTHRVPNTTPWPFNGNLTSEEIRTPEIRQMLRDLAGESPKMALAGDIELPAKGAKGARPQRRRLDPTMIRDMDLEAFK